MGGRGSLSGFTASPNFSIERARKTYQNAINAGFSKAEAMQTVKAAQYQVERIASRGLSEKRDVTSETYEREIRRRKKQVDALFRNRR